MIQRPPRVLHVIKSLGLGGTEKVMQLFVTCLERSRFAPAVFCFRDGERGRQIRAASQGAIPTYIRDDLFSALLEFKPAIVHLHRGGWAEPELTGPVKRYARLGPEPGFRPVVVETNVFGRRDVSAHGDLVDRVLFVSQFCRERYLAAHGLAADDPRYATLYNPVDTDFYAVACPPRGSESGHPPVVGRLSREDPGKWSPLALDMLPELARLAPRFRYRVIGGTEQARAYVREHGLEAHVRFLPPVETEAEIADFFNTITVLAHANSTGESFGLAIAEAMAAGLPVVTHPCPPPRDNAQLELVEHGITGFVARGAREYATAVAWLWRNPEAARSMGEAGRRKAARLFRAQSVARRLESIYEALLASRAGSGQ